MSLGKTVVALIVSDPANDYILSGIVLIFENNHAACFLVRHSILPHKLSFYACDKSGKYILSRSIAASSAPL